METASMAGASTHAPSTDTHITIDPANWLKDFEALGGGYALGEHHLRLCVLLGNQTDAELSLARIMIKSLTLDDRAAIYSHLRTTGAALIGEA